MITVNQTVDDARTTTVALTNAFLAQTDRAALRETLFTAVAAAPGDVVLDLSDVGYLDTRFIGLLVSLSRRCRDGSRRLRLRGLNADLRKLLALTKLDAYFTVEEP